MQRGLYESVTKHLEEKDASYRACRFTDPASSDLCAPVPRREFPAWARGCERARADQESDRAPAWRDHAPGDREGERADRDRPGGRLVEVPGTHHGNFGQGGRPGNNRPGARTRILAGGGRHFGISEG